MPTLRPPCAHHSLLTLAILPLLTFTLTPQTPAAPTPQPLFATLILPLDIARANVGTHIRARVVSPWTADGCDLGLGALVEGHITQVVHHSKNIPRSSLRLVFDTADCNHLRAAPFPATLIALLGPSDADSNGLGKAPPLTDTPNAIGGAYGMRSTQTASAANQYALTGRSLPSRWKIGMVVDCPLNLIVGSRPEFGSLLWTSTSNLRLEAQTTLILVAAKP